MENRFEHIDETIARVLSGEANFRDKNLLQEWIALSEVNKNTFSASEKLFLQSKNVKHQIPVDTDKAWMKVKSRMNVQENDAKIISINSRPWTSFLRIAAMLAIVRGLGVAVYFFITPAKMVNDKIISSADVIVHEILPDGSSITLNKNSSLSYSSAGYGKARIIQLKGEAFFDVKHDDTKVFAIEAGELKIEDIGTSFNVNANPAAKNIVVTVKTGEVKITANGKSEINLVVGETADYNSETNVFVKSLSEDKNITAYNDKIFVFDNTELQVIVKLLNEVYSQNIVFQNDDLKKCRLTASFNNETLDSILGVIAETLQLQVNKTETEIKLNGNGCK